MKREYVPCPRCGDRAEEEHATNIDGFYDCPDCHGAGGWTSTDEVQLIAQAGDYRVLADGKMEYFYHNDIGAHEATWGEPVRMSQEQQDLAALLADAVRQINHRLDGMDLSLNELTERIEAVEVDMNGIDGNHRALSDRVAALETLAADTRTHQEELAIVCEQDIRSVGGRVDALESRQQADDPLLRVNRLVTNIVDMEARQQDEAGEEPRNDYLPWSRGRDHGRRELAREIVERLLTIGDGPDVFDPVSRDEIVAWIESEYLDTPADGFEDFGGVYLSVEWDDEEDS